MNAVDRIIGRLAFVICFTFILSVGGVTAAFSQDIVSLENGEQSTSVSMRVGRATVLNVSKEIAELSIGIPEIADVSVISDRAISILGRAPGRTDLTIFDPGGKLIARVNVMVELELGELRQRLRENFPSEPVSVESAGSNIILSGRVSGTDAMEKIVALAARYTAENGVNNLLEVGLLNQPVSEFTAINPSAQESRNLTLQVGASELIEVTRPYIDLAVGSPDIVEVIPVSEETVQIRGRLPGQTDLSLIGGDGRSMSRIIITVVPALNELRRRLSENFPTEQIAVTPAGNGLVLSGKVSGTSVMNDVVALAGQFVPENGVSNLLEVGQIDGIVDPLAVRDPVSQQESNVTVQVGRSQVIEVTRPFIELAVGSSEIAQVAALSDKSVQILGRLPGRTDLTLIDGQGLAMSLVNIVVVPELSELRERFRELMPGERIEVRSAADGVILSGTVSGASKIQAALALAERYAPERVINLLEVGSSSVIPPGQAVVNTNPIIAQSEVSLDVGRTSVIEVAVPYGSISVGVPEIAEATRLSDRSIQIFGRAVGETDITIVGTNGLAISRVQVRVEPNLTELKKRLQELLPGQAIEVRSAADGVVLSGDVSGGAQITNAIELASRYAPGRVTNLMSVSGTQQVMLQVRFAEVQRSVAKSLGLNFGITGSNSRITFSALSGDNLVGTLAGAFGSASLAINTGDALISAFLDNLEQKGLIRTLAEPNLVALSGDSASFLAGGELPLPVASDVEGDVAQITVEFRPFGVSLAFTPTVVDEDLINLELKTEVSFIDETIEVNTGLISIPGLGVRRAETTVELRDGQSLAIAGLLQDDFNDNVQQFPWLADTPVIGSLLRSSDFERRQTELVVIITPTLVTAVDPESLSLPTDRIQIPNEYELFLLGATESKRQGPAPLGLDGDFGYVIE